MKTVHKLSILALALLLGSVGIALAAQQQRSEPQEMPEHCRQMMEGHEQMQQQMQESDQRLEQLVERMQGTRGEAKVDATAAAVAELVEQRRAMRDGMMEMCLGMMGHMMGHMRGQAGEQSGGMMGCPMMKGMGKEGMQGMQHGDEQPSQADDGAGGSR